MSDDRNPQDGSQDVIRKQVLQQVARQRKRLAAQPEAAAPPRQKAAKVLGLFVDECLKNRGMTRTQFAAALDMERELADGILDGLLPESELNDELVAEIAAVIGYKAQELRVILGRGQGGAEDDRIQSA